MFGNDVKFKYEWRPYQKRVLDQVEKYIKDKKIHIVAAPGSGKTILGLELARYLKKPVLILSPTITIKNQWIDRFISSFTTYNEIPSWVSLDIYDLKFFNVATYQALHYAYKRQKCKDTYSSVEDTDDIVKEEEELKDISLIKQYDIIKEIKDKKISTIILDEAHHLKSAWWNSLKDVIEELGNINIISLTATPPYDSKYTEWKKYIDLCGEIDAYVTVPELVKAKNLCPHQDYIFFNIIEEEQKEKIEKYKKELEDLGNDIRKNDKIKNSILSHRYIKYPYENEEELLENISYYSSMLIYLNDAKVEIPKDNIKILGDVSQNIPSLDVKWLEILLKNIVLNDRKSYKDIEGDIAELERKLNMLGVIENGTISLSFNKTLQDYFINSKGKLNSISKIYEIEKNDLKDNLRMVILTDYIRKEYISNSEENVDKIGVFPIFNKLINSYNDVKAAVLTGKIFVIPKEAKENLYGLFVTQKLDYNKVSYEHVNEDYLIVNVPDTLRNKVMNMISKLFANGIINVIIGTKALLGEGWDEPSINCLVLASFVGSFMLSNQMRGRAIRTNSKDENKTANIWHLVCVNDEDTNYFNPDYEMLKKRFKAYPGISYDTNVITSGIYRLGDKVSPPFNKSRVEMANEFMKRMATNRTKMADKWKSSLEGNNELNIIPSNTKVTNVKPEAIWFINKSFVVASTIFFIVLILGILLKMPFIFKLVLSFIGIYLAVKCINMFIKGKPERYIRLVSEVTLDSLYRCKFIKTPKSKIKIKMLKEENYIMCYITGATTSEANIFITALNEVFSKTDNQRYIIARLNKNLKQINDYYNVPNVLSTKKEFAQVFSKYFRQKIGEHDLVYTKTADGRRMLLRARMKNLGKNGVKNISIYE